MVAIISIRMDDIISHGPCSMSEVPRSRFSILLFPCKREDYILIPTSDEKWQKSDPWALLDDLGWQPIHTPDMLSYYLVFWAGFRTAPPPADKVIQGRSYISWYATTLWQAWWVMNGPCLTCVEHTKGRGFTYNHTPDILSYHPGFLIKLQNCTSTRWWSGLTRIMYIWTCYNTMTWVLGVT